MGSEPVKAGFVITVTTPADGGEYRRLKGALKTLLRSFGLRCVRVQPSNMNGDNCE